MDIPIIKDKKPKTVGPAGGFNDTQWPIKKGIVEKKRPRVKDFRGQIGINLVKRAFRELGTGFHP